MKYSLIIPTRDRPVLFHKTIESISSHTTNKRDVEIVVVCDNDDPISQAYVKDAIYKWPALSMRLLTRDRTEFSNRDYYNWAADQAFGDLIWIFADDLQIVKYNWDVVIWEGYQAAKRNRMDNVLVFSIKDNTPVPRHDMPKFPCFPMFTRECRAFFGWWLHPAPPNWGVDYICYQIMNPSGSIVNFHDDNFLNHVSSHTHQVKEDATSLRIGNIFNKLKMIPKFNTDRILQEEVPELRKKLAEHISFLNKKEQK